MKMKQAIMQHVIHGTELAAQPLPAVPLIEVIGFNRMLIENHICIDSYCPQEISIRVKYGSITVEGDCLQLAYMSPEKLVITGKIRSMQINDNECV